MIFSIKYAEYKALRLLFSVGAGMKPRFVDDMKNITVEVGQDATFVCVVSEIHVSISTSPLSGTFSNILMTAGLSSGLGPGKQQSHPGNWHPRHHTQWKDLRLSRRVQEEVDASHRQGPAGGCRAVHVPAQHGAYEIHHWGPQRHHQARHRGRHGRQSRLRGRQCEVETFERKIWIFVCVELWLWVVLTKIVFTVKMMSSITMWS